MNMQIKYLKKFFAEKDLPYKTWEFEDNDGVNHFIDSEVVIESIMNTTPEEQSAIADMLRKIDFQNGDVMHYLGHLANGLVMNYG